jgi:hypothetical protein
MKKGLLQDGVGWQVNVVLNPSYKRLFSAIDIFYDLHLSRAYVSSTALFSKYGHTVDGFILMSYIRIDKQQHKTSNLPIRIYRVLRHLVMTLGVSIYRNRFGMTYCETGSQFLEIIHQLMFVFCHKVYIKSTKNYLIQTVIYLIETVNSCTLYLNIKFTSTALSTKQLFFTAIP